MDGFLGTITDVANKLNGIIWSPPLVIVCLSAGLYFSIRTRFPQVRHIKEMVRLLFDGSASAEGVSSFQAFAMSISGRVGTGNIAGVATAIAWGGPGALFWMWVIAFLGAGSAFIESTLGQIYKEEIDGQYRGGPAFYISKFFAPKGGMISKFFNVYSILFAVITVLAVGVLLPGVQSNSIAVAVDNAWHLTGGITTQQVVAGLLVVMLAILVFGGVKAISKFAEIIVPFMAGAYILVALIIVFMNFTKIPEVFGLIFSSAFGLNSAFGGILGSTIMWGVKRGVYSNEAGQGTGPHPAAAAEVSHPTKQGLVQAFSVYIDTLFVCSATGFMILMTGMFDTFNEKTGEVIYEGLGVGVTKIGGLYTQSAVDSVFSGFGAPFVAIAILMFAFTTLVAYYYIAETNVSFLIEKFKLPSKVMINLLRIALIGMTAFGAVNTASLAWTLGDIGVGLMAWFNIFAIFIMAKPALDCLVDYEQQMKQGIDPQYDPRKFGITNAYFWNKRADEVAKKAKTA